MAGMTPVHALRMGDAVGNDNKTLYVVLTTPHLTEHGTVRATLAHAQPDGTAQAKVREWLHADHRVHVRQWQPPKELSGPVPWTVVE